MRSAYFVNLLIYWLLDSRKAYSMENVLFSIFKSMRIWDKKCIYSCCRIIFDSKSEISFGKGFLKTLYFLMKTIVHQTALKI